MNEESERKRKKTLKVLILLAVIIVIVMAISVLGNKSNNIVDNALQTIKNTINYVVTEVGNKLKIGGQAAMGENETKTILEKSKIEYINGISKLTTKIVNGSIAKDNFRFRVKFVANDGSIIAETVKYVGKLEPNETKYLDTYIISDVSNSTDIIYEIM